LIRCALRVKTLRDDARGTAMAHKERFILGATMSLMMVFMVTLVATYLNLGPRPDFVYQWAKAYIIAWPVAAGTAYLVMPMARRFTTRVVALIDGSP
jgi:Protein of unknown function (DUF2798)